jgi:hypothetical protein
MAKELLKGNDLADAKKKVMERLATARGIDVSEIKDKTVGNNGRPLDSDVIFTGKVDLIDREINGNKVSYYAAETKKGEWISVQSIMGVSALKGYELEGKFPHQNNEGESDVSADVSAKFKADQNMPRWEPPTRDFYECVAQLQAAELLKDVRLFYRGIAVRPYEAKKDFISTTANGESWSKGAKRTMTAQIWTIR